MSLASTPGSVPVYDPTDSVALPSVNAQTAPHNPLVMPHLVVWMYAVGTRTHDATGSRRLHCESTRGVKCPIVR
jgi:hypothetical protein